MNKRIDYNAVHWDELVYYDETSPSCLRWKVVRSTGRRNLTEVGGSVGGITPRGYYVASLNGRKYLCHRIVWILKNGDIDIDLDIDHFDRNRSNNCFNNLRLVGQRTNSQNTRQSKNNKSGVNGVYMATPRGEYSYWICNWRDMDGKIVSKVFSISALGEEDAFHQACEYRKRMIEEQNKLGAAYTECHGT